METIPLPQLRRSVSRTLKGLRVLLVASFNRRYHQIGFDLARALRNLGCVVARQEDGPRWIYSLWNVPLETRLERALRRHSPDLVLVYKGERLDPAGIARLRTLSPARWANWFPDDPHLLELSLRLAPSYDAFFTHDSFSAALHRERGYPTYYLPFGVDPVRLQPVAVPPRHRSALAFVGTRDAPRAHLLDSITDLGLSAWGPGWPRGPLYGKDFIRALAGADIGLNVHQQVPPLGDPARYGHGANLRVFELAALGTPQLCDAKADISPLFAPDREIVLYRDIAELRAQVERMRRDPAWRASLGAAARQRVLADHTWENRLRTLLSVALK